jgi:hypothetical protein
MVGASDARGRCSGDRDAYSHFRARLTIIALFRGTDRWSDGSVFGVDYQLILERTYFLAVRKSEIVGCGGWSKRNTLLMAIP